MWHSLKEKDGINFGTPILANRLNQRLTAVLPDAAGISFQGDPTSKLELTLYLNEYRRVRQDTRLSRLSTTKQLFFLFMNRQEARLRQLDRLDYLRV